MRVLVPVSLPLLCFVTTAALGPSRARADTTSGGAAASPGSSDEADLARSARLDTIVRLALARNPDIAEADARARASDAHSQAEARLPDLQLKYEQWGVPLARPAALDQANTLMLGIRQTFPAWGAREARRQAAAEQAGGAADAARAQRQDIVAQVRRAYAAYYRADQELRLHLEHAGLTARIVELAKLNQRTGHGSLRDVLRLELELTRVHADVAMLEREQRSSRALLNTLMARAPDAPLGPPEELVPVAGGDVAALERGLEGRRPELDRAARAIRRSQALLEGVRREARFPELMVGVDYWYMPAFPDFHQAYGAMVAINLPWLSGGRRAEERDAEETLSADRHALESARNAVRYQLTDAAARVDAARQSFAIVDQELLAQARRSLEAAQAEYAAGAGDAADIVEALRSYLQVRIERVRALAELASSQADLERAAGTLASEGGRP
jgi:cobalt-zinc-cadmium efflux system outer membrane protein